MQQLVKERGLTGKVRVDSAGTTGYHVGEPPDRRMIEAAKRRGVELISRSRHFTPADFDNFDLIIAMDRENLRDVLRQSPTSVQRLHVKLLSDFLPKGSARDVPDPYYGGAKGFEVVLDMLQEACPPILDDLVGAD